MRTVLSSEAERRNLPFGWKTRARTQLSCPICLWMRLRMDKGYRERRRKRRTSVRMHCPDEVSHKRIVLSRDPVARYAPGDFAFSSLNAVWRLVQSRF
jgi:hypothetical protein